VVELWGFVLAVEGTIITIGASIGCTDGMAVKRRTNAGEDGLCWCYPLRMAERVPYDRATWAWAITGGLVVELWGSVLAVEGTIVTIGASIGSTDGMAVKRRTNAGV